MKKFLSDIYKSLKYEDGGFSGRKLSAFWAVMVATILSFLSFIGISSSELVIIWLVFASVNHGTVTAQQIVELRAGKRDPEINKNT